MCLLRRSTNHSWPSSMLKPPYDLHPENLASTPNISRTSSTSLNPPNNIVLQRHQHGLPTIWKLVIVLNTGFNFTLRLSQISELYCSLVHLHIVHLTNVTSVIGGTSGFSLQYQVPLQTPTQSTTNKNILGRKFKLPARTLWSLLVQSNALKGFASVPCQRG